MLFVSCFNTTSSILVPTYFHFPSVEVSSWLDNLMPRDPRHGVSLILIMVHLRAPKLASRAALSLLLLTTMNNSIKTSCCAFLTPSTSKLDSSIHQLSTIGPFPSTTTLFGKKRKGGTPGPNKNYSSNKKSKGGGGQPQQEKASVKEARFDAATRQFMFTLVGLTKTLPDKSKDILKNINLSFYPGAKIGVVGLNGSGKVC